MIAGHVYDILKNNKVSFNGEFQELSKDLTEKIKNTDAINEVKKPSTRASAAKTTSAKTTSAKTTSAKTTSTGAAKTTSAKTTSTGASAAKKTGTSSAAATAANGAKKPTTGTSTAKTSTAQNPSAGASTAGNSSARVSTTEKPSTRTSTAKMEENPSVNTSTAKMEEKPPLVPNTEKKEERPSFLREVSEFVKKNIVDRKPALVLVDTFLGTVVDKAKKIVRTGKTIAAAFVIATNALAPNLQMAAADQLARMPAPNAVTISVNQNDFKSSAQGTVKAEQHVQQKQQTRTSARR